MSTAELRRASSDKKYTGNCETSFLFFFLPAQEAITREENAAKNLYYCCMARNVYRDDQRAV